MELYNLILLMAITSSFECIRALTYDVQHPNHRFQRNKPNCTDEDLRDLDAHAFTVYETYETFFSQGIEGVCSRMKRLIQATDDVSKKCEPNGEHQEFDVIAIESIPDYRMFVAGTCDGMDFYKELVKQNKCISEHKYKFNDCIKSGEIMLLMSVCGPEMEINRVDCIENVASRSCSETSGSVMRKFNEVVSQVAFRYCQKFEPHYEEEVKHELRRLKLGPRNETTTSSSSRLLMNLAIEMGISMIYFVIHYIYSCE